jgi:predicted esterase
VPAQVRRKSRCFVENRTVLSGAFNMAGPERLKMILRTIVCRALGVLTVVTITGPAAAAVPAQRTVILPDNAVAYVPSKVHGGPVPLLVLLHGAGGRASNFIGQFIPEAEKRGILLLAVGSRGPTWDLIDALGKSEASGREPGEAEAESAVDLPRINAALERVRRCAPGNAAHTALAGFSDGASYALSVAAGRSDLFGTVIAFSPGIAVISYEPSPKQRIFIAHGRRDQILPFAERANTLVPGLRGAGFDITFRPFDGDHSVPAAIEAEALDFFAKTSSSDARTKEVDAEGILNCAKALD